MDDKDIISDDDRELIAALLKSDIQTDIVTELREVHEAGATLAEQRKLLQKELARVEVGLHERKVQLALLLKLYRGRGGR